MSISDRIKQRRIELKLTQTDLATKVGITKGAVGNYETGVSYPKVDILKKLFVALDCDANYLYQDDMIINRALSENGSDVEENFYTHLINRVKSLDTRDSEVILAQIDALIKLRNEQK